MQNLQSNKRQNINNADPKAFKQYRRDKRNKGEMDSGLSWADQWDNNPDPSPRASDDKKKKQDGSSKSKSKFGKSLLSFKWMKELRKKSQQKDDGK